MGLEERQARPHRQDRRHQQRRSEVQGHRRPAAAAETAGTGPRVLRRPAPALYHRIIRSVGLLTAALEPAGAQLPPADIAEPPLEEAPPAERPASVRAMRAAGCQESATYCEL